MARTRSVPDAYANGSPVARGWPLWSFSRLLACIASICSCLTSSWRYLALGCTRGCFAQRWIQSSFAEYQLWRYIPSLQPNFSIIQPHVAELLAFVTPGIQSGVSKLLANVPTAELLPCFAILLSSIATMEPDIAKGLFASEPCLFASLASLWHQPSFASWSPWRSSRLFTRQPAILPYEPTVLTHESTLLPDEPSVPADESTVLTGVPHVLSCLASVVAYVTTGQWQRGQRRQWSGKTIGCIVAQPQSLHTAELLGLGR